jgi:anti-sigma factor RsiW
VTCDYLDRGLDAYVDGELGAEAEGDIRSHLAGCTRCQARVAERHGLIRLVRASPYYEVPDTVRSRIAAGTSRSVTIRRVMALAAAAVLVIAAGGIALLRPAAPFAQSGVDEVVNGHVRSLMADHLFDVRSTDQHTVKPWFLGKLDFSPPVIDLAALGYPLVGGRLDYLRGRPVAALVYQRRQHFINVFVAPESDAAAGHGPAAQSVRGFHVRHWNAAGMSFWAVSDLNEAELTEFMRALQSA